jgi:hypothetical protein
VVVMVSITISNGDDVDDDSDRVVMMGVITISNGDDVDADRKRGGDGGGHYQQWR